MLLIQSVFGQIMLVLLTLAKFIQQMLAAVVKMDVYGLQVHQLVLQIHVPLNQQVQLVGLRLNANGQDPHARLIHAMLILMKQHVDQTHRVLGQTINVLLLVQH